MLFLRKAVLQCFYPLTISLALSFLGLFLLWFTRRQRAGKIAATLAALILAVSSCGLVSKPILRSLEREYPAFDSRSTPVKEIGYVVVLGGGHISDPDVPLSSRINGSGLVRLVEGITLHRRYPNSRLVLSGGTGFDPIPNAEIMKRIALDLGVEEKELIIEGESKDTRDEARLLKPTIGQDPFILVTSAAHMPRAMTLFLKEGLSPIPAPTAHSIRERRHLDPFRFFPDPSAIGRFNRIIKENLGVIWAKVMGYR